MEFKTCQGNHENVMGFCEKIWKKYGKTIFFVLSFKYPPHSEICYVKVFGLVMEKRENIDWKTWKCQEISKWKSFGNPKSS